MCDLLLQLQKELKREIDCIKDAHKKFTAAVQSNEFGKPQTVIDIDFTKEGDPTTKDINFI